MDFLVFLILISLVAVGILTGMLVHQYKSKIVIIEDRMDKMVSIMNGMTQEMIGIKTQQHLVHSYNNPDANAQHHFYNTHKIEVSDSESDSESDSDSESVYNQEDNIKLVSVDMHSIIPIAEEEEQDGSIPSLGDLEEMHSETGSSEDSVQERDDSQFFEVRKQEQEQEQESESNQNNNKLDFGLMSVPELKNYAILHNIGIPTEIKRMKKNELLELIMQG